MKYYKDDSNEIYAFEDDVKQDFLDEKIENLSLIPITEEEEEDIKTQKEVAYKQTDEYINTLSDIVRTKRDTLMSETQNRVDRYNREVAMNISPTDDIMQLYTYMKELADIPEQEGFPTDVTFPEEI